MKEGERLTVLHVCSIKGRGGTGYMAGHLCQLLRDAGARVMVAGCAGSKFEERSEEAGLEILKGLELRRGFRPVSLWRDVARIRRVIAQEKVDVVHAWHSIEYWTCALAVLGTNAKLARTRGLVTPITPHFFNRFVHSHTSALFATCKKIMNNYSDAGFEMENVFPLNDGVDIERFNPQTDGISVRREAGVPDDCPVVVNIGRLEEVKGQSTLLKAAALLADNVHYLFAGGGSLHDALSEEAESLGIAERVHFLGVRSDVEKVLAAGDIYALCSVGSEGSSRATLEAMATGLPCVTTMVGMLPDIVRPGRTGLLYPHGNEGELSECLHNLLLDAGMRRRLGTAARKFVEDEYSERVMAARVLDVYRRVTGRAGTVADG